MKTIRENLVFDNSIYPLGTVLDLNTALFVDIETTGFSAKNTSLYAIGCITFTNNNPELVIYFAEDTSDEKEVLMAFFNLCKEKKTLIHFNGNTFDIPYMKTKATQFDLSHPFDEMEGIDIFKRISPYKSILGFDNCKQKTIEKFLGIDRDDQYNGGQLIEVYKEYTKTKDPELEKLLILHNLDDMKGMLKILPILSYSDIFMVPFRVTKVSANHYVDDKGAENDEVIMKIKFHTTFPVPFSTNKGGCYFSAEGNEGFLKVPMYHEEMKYFYANYKDYFYLPEEDIALHKAVASFVDKNHRKQAKASNCYTRKEGYYLSQWDIIFEPIFKRKYEDKQCFFELTDEMKKEPAVFREYALHILDMVFHAKELPN